LARQCLLVCFSQQANLRFRLAEIWFHWTLLAAQQEVSTKKQTASAHAVQCERQ
jgi:hypothetical protein